MRHVFLSANVFVHVPIPTKTVKQSPCDRNEKYKAVGVPHVEATEET
jgi:hypothetical protein